MIHINIKQIEEDYKYLEKNLPYFCDVDGVLWTKVLFGEAKRIDLLILAIQDMLDGNQYVEYGKNEINWLATDKRVQRIKKRFEEYRRYLVTNFYKTEEF